jgi:hypothetical protein
MVKLTQPRRQILEWLAAGATVRRSYTGRCSLRAGGGYDAGTVPVSQVNWLESQGLILRHHLGNWGPYTYIITEAGRQALNPSATEPQP